MLVDKCSHAVKPFINKTFWLTKVVFVVKLVDQRTVALTADLKEKT